MAEFWCRGRSLEPIRSNTAATLADQSWDLGSGQFSKLQNDLEVGPGQAGFPEEVSDQGLLQETLV